MTEKPQRLSLTDAIASGKLTQFIHQEEARGVKPVDKKRLNAALAKAIKPLKSKHQTSRSASRGNSGGNKTR